MYAEEKKGEEVSQSWTLNQPYIVSCCHGCQIGNILKTWKKKLEDEGRNSGPKSSKSRAHPKTLRKSKNLSLFVGGEAKKNMVLLYFRRLLMSLLSLLSPIYFQLQKGSLSVPITITDQVGRKQAVLIIFHSVQSPQPFLPQFT